MKKIIAALLFVPLTSIAGEMLAKDLLVFCTSLDRSMLQICETYVLGVTQGIQVGQSLVESSDKKITADAHKHVICIPDSVTTKRLARTFVDTATLLKTTFPEDMNLAAPGIIGSGLIRNFSCSKIIK